EDGQASVSNVSLSSWSAVDPHAALTPALQLLWGRDLRAIGVLRFREAAANHRITSSRMDQRRWCGVALRPRIQWPNSSSIVTSLRFRSIQVSTIEASAESRPAMT